MLTFKLKKVKIANVFHKIIMQGINGPCPLIAICNCLILQGKKIFFSEKASTVSSNTLIQVLADHILKLCEGKDGNVTTQMTEVLNLLPSLVNGLDMNPFFTHSGFEFTIAQSLFDLLKLTVIHGWIVDGSSSQEFYKLVEKLSYNKAVEKILLMQDIFAYQQKKQALLQNYPLKSRLPSDKRYLDLVSPSPVRSKSFPQSSQPSPTLKFSDTKTSKPPEIVHTSKLQFEHENFQAHNNQTPSSRTLSSNINPSSIYVNPDSSTQVKEPSHLQTKKVVSSQEIEEPSFRQKSSNLTINTQEHILKDYTFNNNPSTPTGTKSGFQLRIQKMSKKERGEAISEGLLIEDFFSRTPNQITKYGISVIQNKFQHKNLAILFRNNHFSVICKYKQDIFELCTDEGYFNQPTIVWDKLSADLSSSFYNGFFESFETVQDSINSQESSDYLIAMEFQKNERKRYQQRRAAALKKQKEEECTIL